MVVFQRVPGVRESVQDTFEVLRLFGAIVEVAVGLAFALTVVLAVRWVFRLREARALKARSRVL